MYSIRYFGFMQKKGNMRSYMTESKVRNDKTRQKKKVTDNIPISWLENQRNKYLESVKNTNNQVAKQNAERKAQLIEDIISEYKGELLKSNVYKEQKVLVLPQPIENVITPDGTTYNPPEAYEALFTGQVCTIIGCTHVQIISSSGSPQWVEASRIKPLPDSK